MFATLAWINPAKTGALLALPGLIVVECDLQIDLFVRYNQGQLEGLVQAARSIGSCATGGCPMGIEQK